MDLHEYQGKQILEQHGVSVPLGVTTEDTEGIIDSINNLINQSGSETVAIKAQIQAGGRGKGGGIQIANGAEDAIGKARSLLGSTLITPQTGSEGETVHRVLIEQNMYYAGENPVEEFYISILMDRITGTNIIMYSREGGVEIEKVAAETPEKIFKEWINPSVGIQHFQSRKIAFNLGLSGEAFKSMTRFIISLFKAYEAIDASLIEINPVIKTSDNKIFAADAKVKIDDSALYKHPEIASYNEITASDPLEAEAAKYGLNFVKLTGNVGCMVNGAGLAMATMDMIKLAGGNPANFLDVGGKANPETIEAGFLLIAKSSNVSLILVNIFGGIVRCDRIAEGIANACKSMGSVNIPIIVRLQGTNANEGRQILENAGLKVISADTLQDASDAVQQVLKR